MFQPTDPPSAFPRARDAAAHALINLAGHFIEGAELLLLAAERLADRRCVGTNAGAAAAAVGVARCLAVSAYAHSLAHLEGRELDAAQVH